MKKTGGKSNMPLYEYRCKKCEKIYEALVSISKADDPGKCPHCGFEKSDRLLSTFSPSMGSSAKALSCADTCNVPGGG
jgi:putative FmdB family regulatory protein